MKLHNIIKAVPTNVLRRELEVREKSPSFTRGRTPPEKPGIYNVQLFQSSNQSFWDGEILVETESHNPFFLGSTVVDDGSRRLVMIDFIERYDLVIWEESTEETPEQILSGFLLEMSDIGNRSIDQIYGRFCVRLRGTHQSTVIQSLQQEMEKTKDSKELGGIIRRFFQDRYGKREEEK